MKAIVYLNKYMCEKRQQGYEMEARAFAAKHGYQVDRTVVESRTDTLPWLLMKAEALDVDAIVTPSLHHIQHRAQDVLGRCDLLIVCTNDRYRRGSTVPAIRATGA
ncbi:hypothetical protein [Nocardia cyriacigeorgica]|uniref:hypothetical protein n=1 Tax=Nocardia cyriacigeorgica TaxID=135487 RepID=UPI002456F186|nr:hypothetical protein [Nocardia cyriacigeorgica]